MMRRGQKGANNDLQTFEADTRKADNRRADHPRRTGDHRGRHLDCQRPHFQFAILEGLERNESDHVGGRSTPLSVSPNSTFTEIAYTKFRTFPFGGMHSLS
jgi:hypothetical protein